MSPYLAQSSFSVTFSAQFPGACYLGQPPLNSFSSTVQLPLSVRQAFCPLHTHLILVHTWPLKLNPNLGVTQDQGVDPERTGRMSACRAGDYSHNLLIQKSEAERLGTPSWSSAPWLCFHRLHHHVTYFLDWTFSSALGECDGGYPVIHAAALLAEQTQLVQSRVFPGVWTGALKQEQSHI